MCTHANSNLHLRTQTCPHNTHKSSSLFKASSVMHALPPGLGCCGHHDCEPDSEAADPVAEQVRAAPHPQQRDALHHLRPVHDASAQFRRLHCGGQCLPSSSTGECRSLFLLLYALNESLQLLTPTVGKSASLHRYGYGFTSSCNYLIWFCCSCPSCPSNIPSNGCVGCTGRWDLNGTVDLEGIKWSKLSFLICNH